MSDYFGALMRASGMTLGAPTPSHMALATTVEPLEFDSIMSPAVMAAQAPAAEPASHSASATAPVPATVLAEPVQMPHSPVVTGAREVQASALPAIAHNSRTDADSIARVGVAPPTAPVVATPNLMPSALVPQPAPATKAAGPDRDAPAAATAPQGQDLVRIALQWVAAGPQQPQAQSEPRPHALATETQASSNASLVQLPQPNTPAQAHVAIEPAGPSAATPSAGAPGAAIEPVQVSIGAIHLRVSPPAAHTIERAPAPPAAPPAPVVRSVLSRRALRRI